MSELSGSLLQVLTPEEQYRKRHGFPLMMEFPVNPALAPFLVSSTKAVLWVKSYNGRVRAAVRETRDLPSFFWETTEAVIEESRAENWGNVQPLSRSGLQAVIAHVESYDVGDGFMKNLEILAHPETDWGGIDPEWAVPEGDIPMALLGLPLQPAPWVQPNTLVVVPKDRGFVGFVMLFGGRIMAVVHNASRGIGIATSWQPPVAGESA